MKRIGECEEREMANARKSSPNTGAKTTMRMRETNCATTIGTSFFFFLFGSSRSCCCADG
jgi:hypothetical protein